MVAADNAAIANEGTRTNQAFLVDLAGNNKLHHLEKIERMFCENESSQFDKLHSIFYAAVEGSET